MVNRPPGRRSLALESRARLSGPSTSDDPPTTGKTRSAPGGLLPFKSGGFEAAIATGTPVVPIGIVGSGRVIERGGFRVRPGWIRVRIGEPIETGAGGETDRAALAARAQAAAAELMRG